MPPPFPRYRSDILVATLADGHDHGDDDGGRHDDPKQVLQDDGAGIGSRHDVGDEAVNDHEGHDTDDYGYKSSY